MSGRRWTLLEVVQGKPLGHPTHALLVHYPVAFALGAMLLDVLDGGFARAAAYLSVAAVPLGVIAAATGLVDWWGMIPGSRKRRFGTLHLVIQSTGIALLVLAALLRWPDVASTQATAVTAAAFLTLLVGNYFGGELVYGMGMRVRTAEREERRGVADRSG